MNKKFFYTVFGIIAVIAIVLLAVALSKGSGTQQGANIFSASSDISTPPFTMNSLNPSEPDQTNFAIYSDAYDAQLSADGNYIVFVTRTYGNAPGLVPNPNNSPKINQEQVYRRNLTTGVVDLASSTDGTIMNAATWGQTSVPAISSDGRYVVFVSGSWDPAGKQQVYLKDMINGTLLLASSADGVTGQTDNYLYNPDVSADGQVVCWGSSSNTAVCKFFSTGQLTTVASTGTSSEGYISLSADGQYLSYFAGTGAGIKRVSLADLSSMQVSDPANSAYISKISADGNLVEWVDHTTNQSMVKNMTTGSVVVASQNATGQNANGSVQRASISENGRFVAFSSTATNLIAGVSGLQTYLVDLQNIGDGPMLCSSRDATNPTGTFNPDGYYGDGDQGADAPSVNNAGTLCAFVASSDGGPNQLVMNTSDSAWSYGVYVKDLGTIIANPPLGDPMISMATQSMIFGADSKNPQTQQIVITNTGNAPLNVSAEIIDVNRRSKFSVVAPTSPIAPGASGILAITFAPGGGKPLEQIFARVEVTHDGINASSPISVSLQGIRSK